MRKICNLLWVAGFKNGYWVRPDGGESSDSCPSSMDPTKSDSQIRLDLSLIPGGEHRLRWGGFQGEGRGQSSDGGIPPHPL